MYQNPQGETIYSTTHQVTTESGAEKWGIDPGELPATVKQWKTPDGRIAVEIWSGRKLLMRRG